jgi:hypothetical protein
MRTNLLHSARARFAATASVVFALVALGGVTAIPAAAAPATVTITVQDNAQGGLLPNRTLTMESQDGSFSQQYTTSSSAEFTVTVEEGSYRLVPGGQYVPSAYFTISAAQSTMSVPVTKPKIAGSIPAGAANGHTTVGVEIQGSFPSGNTYWYEVASFVVNSADGTFAYLLQVGTNTYRLNFRPDATVPYLGTITDPVVVDGTVDTVSIGAVTLPPAGSITGTITGTPGGSAISGATVTATSGASTVATATTGADGSYFLKLSAAPATVTVTAVAPGFESQSYGTAVTLNSGNGYAVSGINIVLPRLPANVIGNLTQYGGGNEPYPVDTYLYRYDTATSTYLATPFGTTANSANFTFSDLPDGNYRLAFRDSSSDQILTWRIRDRYVSPGYPSGGYGDCSLDFTISTGGDLQLPNIELTQQAQTGYCASPPYTSPSDKAVTGTVSNTDSLSPTVNAKLYKVAGDGSVSVVDVSPVDPASGAYALDGVRDDGDYFVQFVPDAASTYLPMLLGDAGTVKWAKDDAAFNDFAANSTFAIDVSDASTLSGHDITLEQGALFSGTLLTEFGDAIHGQVTFTNVNDPTDTLTVTGNGDGWGSWRAVLPVGGTYSLRAVALEGYYASEYWQNATTLAAATLVGPLIGGDYGSFEFRLADSPASLYGYLSDVTDDDPITVHLFTEDSYGTWQPVAVLDSVDAEVYFSNLDGGIYRMRFEKNGQWLQTTSSRTGTLPDAGGPYSAPTCFVSIDGVADGSPSFIEANFDSGNQTALCEAEPDPEGDVTGRVVSSAATGSENVAGVTVMLMDGMNFRYFDAVTNAQGEFTIEDVPNGDYGIVIAPTMGAHVNGTHEYLYVTEDTFEGGKDLGDIVPLRLGNVSGDIADWDEATMAGASATVYQYIDCGCADPTWESVGIPVEIDSDGHFDAPGIAEDGQYSVFVDFDGMYVDSFIGGGTSAPTAPFTGTAELDYTYATATVPFVELVAITGTAFYGDFPLEYGYVYAELPDGSYYETEVTEDGSYELLVAPNQDYLVSVWYDSLMIQYYEGVNYDPDFGGPFTGTAVPVGDSSVSGINFSLIAPQDDTFYLYTGTDAGFPGASYQFNDVEVHLYQYVVDGWEEVASEVTGPYAELTSSGGGDYRLRFSKDGEWLNVEQMQWDNYLPPFDESDGYVAVDSCFIEFSDLDHGSQVSIDAILDPDGVASGCGPEDTVEHFEVLGSTVQSDTFVNAPIVGQTVTLTNTTTGYVFTTTTDSNGVYDFTGVTAGTYTLSVPTAVGSSGYAYVSHTQTVVVDDLEALDPIKLTRYGNVELEIANWDASMAGATAQVQLEGPAGVWTPVGLLGTVDSAGTILVPAIAVTGTYRVWVDLPAGFVDGYVTEWYSPDVTAELDGVAEYDIDDVAFRALTMISGVVRLGATPVAGAAVTAENSAGYVWSATTATDGSFSMAVQVDETFTLEATKAGLVRAIDTAFVVGFAPVTNVDLAMKYSTFFVETYTGAEPLTVHLYKKVTGGWQEVASDTYTEVYLWSTLSGDYRLRFSDGADWLAVSEYELDGTTVTPASDVCFIDVAPAVGGSEYEFVIDPVASTECGAEPAVVAPPVTPGTTGSGTKKPVAFTTPVVTAPTEEVVPTSTPTPTPEPSDSATAEPENETSDGAEGEGTTASAPDLTWVFVVAGILVLLVLAGGAVYLVRRRP